MACLGFWIPFAGVVAGIVALILGIVAWRKASSGRAGGKPMAIIGTILGGVAIVGGIVATIFLIWVFGHVAHCTDRNFTDEERQACVDTEFNVDCVLVSRRRDTTVGPWRTRSTGSSKPGSVNAPISTSLRWASCPG